MHTTHKNSGAQTLPYACLQPEGRFERVYYSYKLYNNSIFLQSFKVYESFISLKPPLTLSHIHKSKSWLAPQGIRQWVCSAVYTPSERVTQPEGNVDQDDQQRTMQQILKKSRPVLVCLHANKIQNWRHFKTSFLYHAMITCHDPCFCAHSYCQSSIWRQVSHGRVHTGHGVGRWMCADVLREESRLHYTTMQTCIVCTSSRRQSLWFCAFSVWIWTCTCIFA